MDTFSIFIFWNLQYLILLMTFFLKSVPFHFRSSISPTSLGIIVNKLHQLFSIRPYLLFCFLWFSSWPHSSLTLHFFPWGISPIIWVLDLVPGSSPYTIKQLWHYLLEVSIRCHWWRAQPPYSHFQYQLQMHVVTSTPYQPVTNWEFQQSILFYCCI